MSKTTLENLKLGIFVILGTALLVLAAYLIGNRQNMFGNTFGISAVFKNVNGLQNGNNVRFSGINVGTVDHIEMINDSTIKVDMVIEEKMLGHIRKDAVATIGSDGLVGSMIINILPGEGSASLVEPGDNLTTYSRLATQDMLNTLNTTNENAALLTADLLKVTRSLTQGKGTLGKLLNDTVMAADIKQTIVNLKHTSNEANRAIKELHEKINGNSTSKSVAGVVLNDTISGIKMQKIIHNLENSSAGIDTLVHDLNLVLKKYDNEKGALHYLAKDTVLVGQLEKTMENIEQGTERFNENMEALKHNFLTRRYFRKLERQQKKEME